MHSHRWTNAYGAQWYWKYPVWHIRHSRSASSTFHTLTHFFTHSFIHDSWCMRMKSAVRVMENRRRDEVSDHDDDNNNCRCVSVSKAQPYNWFPCELFVFFDIIYCIWSHSINPSASILRSLNLSSAAASQIACTLALSLSLISPVWMCLSDAHYSICCTTTKSFHRNGLSWKRK